MAQTEQHNTEDVANEPVSEGFGPNSLSEAAWKMIASRETLGCIDHPDARGRIAGWCGDTMQIDLRLMGGLIKEARYITDGCWATHACGSMITHMVQAMSVAEAERISPADLVNALGGLPEDHQHCASLAVSTLRDALHKVKAG